jgi:hypothetical protein
LLSEPQLKLEGSAWTLLLWVCDPFDDQYSFREFFVAIVAVLQQVHDAKLTLPPEKLREDFVDGTLRWGTLVYDVYFERSLGYVQFSNASEPNTRELLDVLESSFVWRRGTENIAG